MSYAGAAHKIYIKAHESIMMLVQSSQIHILNLKKYGLRKNPDISRYLSKLFLHFAFCISPFPIAHGIISYSERVPASLNVAYLMMRRNRRTTTNYSTVPCSISGSTASSSSPMAKSLKEKRYTTPGCTVGTVVVVVGSVVVVVVVIEDSVSLVAIIAGALVEGGPALVVVDDPALGGLVEAVEVLSADMVDISELSDVTPLSTEDEVDWPVMARSFDVLDASTPGADFVDLDSGSSEDSSVTMATGDAEVLGRSTSLASPSLN